MKRLIICSIIAIFIFQIFVDYQNLQAETRGFSALRIGVGGKAVGMGEAFSAVSVGAIATYWNPAGLLETSKNELITAHNRWLFDLTSEFVAFAQGKDNYAWGLSLYYTDAGEIEARTFRNEREPIGFFGANDLILGLSFAKKIKKELDFGLTIKYLYEKIYIENASGYAFDLGVRYRLFNENLCTGIVIKNIGVMNEMKNEKVSLPSSVRMGGMYDFSNILNKKDFLLFSIDYEFAPDYNDHILFGTEVNISKEFALRGGYQSGYQDRNFCGGIGISMRFIKVDYGFTPFASDLGNTHRFSMQFNW